MGKEHLPQLLEDHLFLLVLHGEGNVFQGKPLHPGAGLPRLFQGHQGGPGGHDGVPHGLRQPVPVPGGPGGGIGKAAGGQDHGPGREGLLGQHHAGDPPILHLQSDGPVLFLGDACPFQGIEKGVDHVGGPVGTGKNTSPSFRLQGDA